MDPVRGSNPTLAELFHLMLPSKLLLQSFAANVVLNFVAGAASVEVGFNLLSQVASRQQHFRFLFESFLEQELSGKLYIIFGKPALRS